MIEDPFLSILILFVSLSFDAYLFLYYFSGLKQLPAFRAEGEPVTFQVGGNAFRGATAFAGVPGGLDGLVYELSDILWSVVVIDSESAKLLFDLRDFDGRVRVCGVEGIDGRCDFLDQRPPSFSALPGDLGNFALHRSEVLWRRGQRASTESMVRATK